MTVAMSILLLSDALHGNSTSFPPTKSWTIYLTRREREREGRGGQQVLPSLCFLLFVPSSFKSWKTLLKSRFLKKIKLLFSK